MSFDEHSNAEIKSPRYKFVSVRCKPGVHAEIKRRAAAEGLDMSEFIRNKALDKKYSPRPARLPKVDHDAVTQLTVAINRVGNNINQMAKVMNQGGYLGTDEISEAKNILERAALDAIKLLRGF